ncbi:CapA family protein [bacterium]|nr:MAG: CapA family protein [bacterium]
MKISFNKYYQRGKVHFTSRNGVFIILITLLVGAILGYGIWNRLPAGDINYSKAALANGTLESHILIGGDVYWGRGINEWSQQSNLKHAYPFSKLDELERDSYDAWIANLECPIVPNVEQSPDDPNLINFNCNPDYLPEAAKWFTAFSLANNHLSNQGREAGQRTTREQLSNNGIQYFGGFNPHNKEDICDVIQMPARVKDGNAVKTASLPVAMCGYHGVYYKITDEALDEISRYAAYMPVVVMPHMGREYQSTVDSKRAELYRTMIDRGADMVIGNHPHWVQPSEAYKGKLIVYSMGNFIFDQQFNEEVSRSVAIDIQLSSSDSVENIARWTELAKQCSTFRDNCLAQAEQLGLKKLSYDLHYDVVGVSIAGKITHRANQREKDSIMQRMNWAQVEKQITHL